MIGNTGALNIFILQNWYNGCSGAEADAGTPLTDVPDDVATIRRYNSGYPVNSLQKTPNPAGATRFPEEDKRGSVSSLSSQQQYQQAVSPITSKKPAVFNRLFTTILNQISIKSGRQR
jgi:hypothetical protein